MWPRDPLSPFSLPYIVRFRRLYVRNVPEPQVVPSHLHEDLELVLPLSGEWRGTLNGESLRVPAGGALVVAPGDRHEDRCHVPMTLHGISLHLLTGTLGTRGEQTGQRRAWSASPLASAATVAQRRLASAPVLHAIVARLVGVTRDGGAWAVMRQDALAHELVVELLAMLPPAARSPLVADHVAAAGFAEDVAAVLAAHPAGLSVPALSAAMGVAERTLQLRCRRVFAATPLAVITRHRLAMAHDLLATGAAVQAVADHLGFANPFHFSTAYKRAFGHPPSRAVRKVKGSGGVHAWPEDRAEPTSVV